MTKEEAVLVLEKNIEKLKKEIEADEERIRVLKGVKTAYGVFVNGMDGKRARGYFFASYSKEDCQKYVVKHMNLIMMPNSDQFAESYKFAGDLVVGIIQEIKSDEMVWSDIFPFLSGN